MVNKTLPALILTRFIASVEFIDESGANPREHRLLILKSALFVALGKEGRLT